MFIQLIIAMILGLAYPSNTNTGSNNNSTVTTATTDPGEIAPPDTGGDKGQTPPPK